MHKTGIAFTIVAAAAALACADDPPVIVASHADGPTFDAGRPECPVRWTDSKLPYWRDTTKRTPGLTIPTPITVPQTGLGVAGPITDIPEFHDCQKFALPGGAAYDSLFAIFAASNLDSVVTALTAANVAWTSSDVTKATVTAAGTITGVAPGTVTIMGVSTRNAALTVEVPVTVVAVAGRGGAAQNRQRVREVSPFPAVRLRIGEQLSLVGRRSPQTVKTLAVGEVYTYGPGYKPLGIGPGLSCLYVYFDATGHLRARMVHVGTDTFSATSCVGEVDPNVGPPPRLVVARHAGDVDADYPAAARWDFDATNRQYSIGIKCGAAWCDIGANGAVDFAPPATLPTTAGPSLDEERVTQVKGWYDQQELAMPAGTPGAVTGLVPSGIIATVVPHPDLRTYTLADYSTATAAGPWRPTGYIALNTAAAKPLAADYYKTKLGLTAVSTDRPLSDWNRLHMCIGSESDCAVPAGATTCGVGTGTGRGSGSGGGGGGVMGARRLWVRISPAGGGAAVYRCGVRRVHDNTSITYFAATARWRWKLDDETVWEYCAAAGCCEIIGGL